MTSTLHVAAVAICLTLALSVVGVSVAAGEADLLLQQADSLYAAAEYEAAGDLADRISVLLTRNEAAEPTLQLARVWLDAGRLFFSLSRFARADSTMQRATDLAQQAVGPNDTTFAEFLSVLASVHRARGYLDRAEATLKRSLAIHESWGERNELLATAAQVRLASLYLYMHRLEDVEPLLRKAYSIRVAHFGEDHELVATVLSLQAGLRELQGRVDEAEVLYLRALAILRERKGPDYAGVARIQTALGSVYRVQNRYAESRRAYENAIEIYSSEANEMFGASAGPYARLGTLFMEEGRYREADSCIRKAQSIRRQHPGVGDIFFAYGEWQLGQLYTRVGRLDEAEVSLLSALLCIRETLGPLHPSVINVQADLAKLYAVRNDWQRSLAYYDSVLTAQRSVTRAWFAASSERDKLSWITKYPQVDPSLITFALASGRPEAVELAGDMVLAGKGVVVDALAVQSESVYCSMDETTQAQWEQRADLCNEIAGIAMGHFPSELNRRINDTLVQLNQVLDSLETALSRSCSQLENRLLRDDVRTQTIRNVLSSGTVLWEIIKYDPVDLSRPRRDQSGSRYAAFVIRPDQKTVALDLGEADRIDSLVFAIRTAIARAGHAIYGGHGPYLESLLQQRLATMYELVVAPLAARSGSCQLILVSADGALNLFPFGITVDLQGRYVIETTAFHYVSSGRELLGWHEPKPNSGAAVVIADPAFDAFPVPLNDEWTEAEPVAFRSAVIAPDTQLDSGGFPQLPFTQVEAEAVIGVFRQHGDMEIQSYTGLRANESVLRSLPAPPRLLHLATHGFARSEPDQRLAVTTRRNPLLRAGLAFAGANRPAGEISWDAGQDGILTALEATGLQLYGTELVALSACESGLGDVMAGEGVFGLRRAFTYAGADAVLMSLWKVADDQTARLMRVFYSEWLSGNSKQEALRYATLAMLREAREKYGNGHPALWAGFVLTGNPD